MLFLLAAKTQERLDYGFQYLGPVITRKHTLYMKRGDGFTINTLEDIKNQKLYAGCLLGDWRSKFLKKQGIPIQNVGTYKQNVLKLLAGRVSLMVASDMKIKSLLNKVGVGLNEVEPVYVFRVSPSFIMFSKGTDQNVIDQWKKAFSKISKTDYFKKLSKKWSKILLAPIKYSHDKGLYVDQ
ncbi:MAG: amino acid ABC transporter substrate-binding protein [Desulfobacterales bacterium]|nr:amino acid ABC transporter substrate-binding protein [Desulfobacterales bacterium]